MPALRTAVLAAAAVAGVASANDNVRPFVGASVLYNSNVLGLRDRDAALALTGEDDLGDTSRTFSGGIDLDWKLSRQTLSARIAASTTKYSRLSALDHDGKDLLAKWGWEFGDYVSGNLGASYVESLSTFTDFHQYARSLRTQRRDFFDAAWRLHPSWRVTGQVARRDLDYRLESQSGADRIETQYQAGIDYVSRAGNSVGVLWRRGKNEYQTVRAGSPLRDFRQQDMLLRAEWRAAGKTHLTVSAGRSQRQYDSLSNKNYSGASARVEADWAVSGKLLLNAAIWREIGSVEDLLVNHSVNRGMSFSPQWLVSEKVTLRGEVRYERRRFLTVIGGSDDFGDRVRNASVSVVYQPYRALSLETTAFYGSKDADSALTTSYRRQGIAFNVRHTF
ncbi:hypothetical protein NCCP691_25150 [Noviherbaspirillum aridicola]|uniref:Exopolysaccharide biosynthesis operon protein EpsL n=2 Tax=Noviherbaspirillum aridicola TaxID=2849687 RepID=A0ABQ4Q5M0_9BURK|nr:hypothetical protein NCCP691_25150 [Noviherbaspirillum aridicola]